MFYILFIVRNLCNLILSIEGHSFDLLQPQAVAVVRNLHLHHQDHPVHLKLILSEMDEWKGCCGDSDLFISISGEAELNQNYKK